MDEKDSAIQLLRKVSLLAKVPLPLLEKLSAEFKVLRYEPGDLVIAENSSNPYFYIIAQGEVLVSKAVNEDTETHLATLREGNFFGEFSLIGEEENLGEAYVEANSDLLCYRIRGQKLRHFAEENPTFAAIFYFELFRELTLRIENCNAQIRHLMKWSLNSKKESQKE